MIDDVWLTRDDSDPVENIELNLLAQIETIQLTDGLREKLGKAYSPGASSQTSRVYKGYGTFAVSASVDVKDLGLTRAEIAASIAGLRDHPVSDDLLLRARAPLVQGIDNALKTNGSWLGLVARAQSQPDRIDRLTKAKARMLAITPAQLQATARRYLADAAMVDVAALRHGGERALDRIELDVRRHDAQSRDGDDAEQHENHDEPDQSDPSFPVHGRPPVDCLLSPRLAPDQWINRPMRPSSLKFHQITKARPTMWSSGTKPQ